MKAPKEHKKYLAKRNYPLKCSSKIFKAKEIEFLKNYGYWIEALVSGAILPVTKKEQRLIDGKAEPENDEEKTWSNLIERRIIEANAKKLPHYSLRDKSEEWFSRSDWKKMRSR
jgi:uncharacterized protein YifE (UPF0438 family)